jgi:hypothetical protein
MMRKEGSDLRYCIRRLPLIFTLETSVQELTEVLGEPLIKYGLVSYSRSGIRNPKGKWVIPHYAFGRTNIKYNLHDLKKAITAGDAMLDVMIDPTGFRSDEDAVMFKLRSI